MGSGLLGVGAAGHPPASQYAGSAACRACHPAQFKQQSQTGHARALSRANEHPLGPELPEQRGEWAFGAGHQAVTFVSRIDEDRYPSGELMDRVELALDSPEHVAAYLDVLFGKVDDCHYPSRHILDRIARFAPMI